MVYHNAINAHKCPNHILRSLKRVSVVQYHLRMLKRRSRPPHPDRRSR